MENREELLASIRQLAKLAAKNDLTFQMVEIADDFEMMDKLIRILVIKASNLGARSYVEHYISMLIDEQEINTTEGQPW